MRDTCCTGARFLLLVLLSIIIFTTLLSRLGLLSSDTARTSTTKWRAQGEVDVLLGVETDDEGRNVNDLLANTDMSLANEDTGVVDRLGETEFVDTGLKTTLQEILNLQCQHVIELHARLIENTNTDETTNKCISFEKSLGILLVEGEQLTTNLSVDCALMRNWRFVPGSTTNLGESELDTPTSRLLRRPYSPTSLSSESFSTQPESVLIHSDLSRGKLLLIGR